MHRWVVWAPATMLSPAGLPGRTREKCVACALRSHTLHRAPHRQHHPRAPERHHAARHAPVRLRPRTGLPCRPGDVHRVQGCCRGRRALLWQRDPLMWTNGLCERAACNGLLLNIEGREV